METEIERMYNILQELRKLENNVNHEFNMDMANMRRGIRYLHMTYEEMQLAHIKGIEDQKKEDRDRERIKEILDAQNA